MFRCQLLPWRQCEACFFDEKNLDDNQISKRDAKNNGRAALNEKAPTDHQNDEDNVNVSTKVLGMKKRMQVLRLITSIFSYVVKVAIRNINEKKGE